MKVVFDAGVVFAGAGWRNEPHLCLVSMARRQVTAFATDVTVEELRGLVARKRSQFPNSAAADTILRWYFSAVHLTPAAPLGKPRSRDPKDDPYLACAVGAGAQAIISRDADLLVLEKPFGVEILTPRQLLSRLLAV